jgi:hypothetical protein
MQGRDDREVTGELRADWKKGQRHYSLNQHPITRKKPHRSNAGCELRELGARAHGCWDHRLENAFIVKGNQHTTVNGNAGSVKVKPKSAGHLPCQGFDVSGVGLEHDSGLRQSPIYGELILTNKILAKEHMIASCFFKQSDF